MNIFLSNESNSCHKKSFLVTGNPFLSQEIYCSKNNSLFWVKLALLICGITGLLLKILPEPINFMGTWFPGSP